ncbi:MAG: MlaD family protein [Gammaproteobacteria bacterium]|nr:MlaD family protein [Gammaproteobacteria bacterium]
MRKQRTIGLFVLGGLALLALGLILFGSTKWFRDANVVMMTFEGDVKGLNVGSRVTFRGVQIGTVTSISLHLNPDGSVTVPVLAEIDTSNKTFEMVSKDRRELLEVWKRQGLKARLVSESFVTGLLQIQLEFFPSQAGYLFTDPEGYDYLQIPTVPTALEEAAGRLERFAQSFERMPLESITRSLDGVLAGLDHHLNSDEMATLIHQLSEASTRLNAVLAHLDERKGALTGGVEQSLQAFQQMTVRVEASAEGMRQLTESAGQSLQRFDTALVNFNDTMARAQRTLQAYQDLAQPDAQVQQVLMQTLRTLDAAGQQLRQLAETLQRNPEAVLTGKQR